MLSWASIKVEVIIISWVLILILFSFILILILFIKNPFINFLIHLLVYIPVLYMYSLWQKLTSVVTYNVSNLILSLHLRSYIELDSDQNTKARPKNLYLKWSCFQDLQGSLSLTELWEPMECLTLISRVKKKKA